MASLPSDFSRHSLFSAAAELATLKHPLRLLGSLEERIGRKPIVGIPRGFAPLVAGKVYTLPRRGGRKSDRRRTPVGSGNAKRFPLQSDLGRLS